MQPLEGIKVIEIAGLAPGPYCGMILSDFGADVVIVDRPEKMGTVNPIPVKKNPLNRKKRFMRVDMKTEEGIDILRGMIKDFDILIDPFRPGVMESLGLGPEEALKLNPKLIYARLTGWGQNGPFAKRAGHDINYISLSGALSLFRRKGERPLPPTNLLGDFAAGGMLCAMGILLALIERTRSGKGQVVDAAMVDGAAYLETIFYGLLASQEMSLDIGTNLLDSGAHFYQTYETLDGKYVAVGAIESKFYSLLLNGLGLAPESLPDQNDKEKWPEVQELFAQVFKKKTRDEWAAIFEGTDACVTPVLGLDEVDKHPHNRERGLIINIDGIPQPAPAPRLSRTPAVIEKAGSVSGTDTVDVLKSLGYSEEMVDSFTKRGIVE